MRSDMIRPRALRRGDKIGIVAPATEVRREYVEGAADFLRGRGYEPVVFPNCLDSRQGTYAAGERERLLDLETALTDPEIRCVLCARGGYGCVHLISHIPQGVLQADPKWVVGFSDVSALHAMMLRAGVMSLHAGMAKHLCESPAGDESVEAFMSILEGGSAVSYDLTGRDGVRIFGEGVAQGVLRGGNLAVLDGLAATPFDMLHIGEEEDVILFLEDVGEAIYRVERMLWRLHLGGTLKRMKGLVLGDFTDYRPDRNFSSMEEMLEARLREWRVDVPVLAGFPCGHAPGRNLPLVEGSRCRLEVTPGSQRLDLKIGL